MIAVTIIVCVTAIILAGIVTSTVRSALDSYRGGVRVELSATLNSVLESLPQILTATLDPWVRAFIPPVEVDGEVPSWTAEQWAELSAVYPGGVPGFLEHPGVDVELRPPGARPVWADPLNDADTDDPDPIRLDKTYDDWTPLPDVDLERMAARVNNEEPDV